jgi:hypothetical protein
VNRGRLLRPGRARDAGALEAQRQVAELREQLL